MVTSPKLKVPDQSPRGMAASPSALCAASGADAFFLPRAARAGPADLVLWLVLGNGALLSAARARLGQLRPFALPVACALVRMQETLLQRVRQVGCRLLLVHRS